MPDATPTPLRWDYLRQMIIDTALVNGGRIMADGRYYEFPGIAPGKLDTHLAAWFAVNGWIAPDEQQRTHYTTDAELIAYAAVMTNGAWWQS